jgi:predicted dehydrogenase
MNRRDFLAKTAVATAGLTAISPKPGFAQTSPNETINIAIIGIRGDNKEHPTWTGRGRGQDHYEHLSKIPNVRVTHVVDVDERHFAGSLSFMKERWGGDPKTETDFRRVLENPEVDAITVATPDHWHALMTIWAVQAGKDVYVEKPLSHNIHEGRMMIEAARRHNRIVSVGTQRRSDRLAAVAAKFLREGGLGHVYSGKTTVYRPRDPIGVVPDSPVPPGVHYDLWLGPAPARPFNRNRFHYNWHWHWDYGNGDTGNQGPHQFDIARWGLKKQEHPVKIQSVGGYYGPESSQETPDTQTSVFEYADGLVLEFATRGQHTNDEGGQRIGNLFYGTEGWLWIDGNGRQWQSYLGRTEEKGPGSDAPPEEGGSDPLVLTSIETPHYQNFVEAIRAGNPKLLTCDALEGHLSSSLPHLANISYRVSRPLKFDPATEKFVGDPEADKLLTREYRKGFEIKPVTETPTARRDHE